MPHLSLDQLPEAFVSDTSLAPLVSKEMKRRRLRKLASRLYTKNLTDPPEIIVRCHLWPLVGAYFPGGLIADRTALENAPAADGSIFLISDKKRSVTLPGITIKPRRGIGPLKTDKSFINGLFLCSTARAYLENMKPSRARKGLARTLSIKEIEQRLEALLQNSGETALNRLRDEMRELASELRLDAEFRKIDELIGTLLGTRQAQVVSDVAKARTAGFPYDPQRFYLFQELFSTLTATAPFSRPEKPDQRSECLSFFDAYFSNFIEGTEFEVKEAKQIIFEGKIPQDRPEDAHDILGTYRIVSDRKEMERLPKDFDEFISLLQLRHAGIMEQRSEKKPGQFKTVDNRAGTTLFVSPDLVIGTLGKGFDFYKALDEPFRRAVFMMFLVAEVHPFTDGNGRLARIMMNAELIASKESRIIIPTVYRNNYLVALKVHIQSGKATPLIRTLDFAQKYVHSIDWSTFETSQLLLEKTNAFLDSYEADSRGIRLVLPSSEL